MLCICNVLAVCLTDFQILEPFFLHQFAQQAHRGTEPDLLELHGASQEGGRADRLGLLAPTDRLGPKVSIEGLKNCGELSDYIIYIYIYTIIYISEMILHEVLSYTWMINDDDPPTLLKNVVFF